jgi:RND superfamily putative drug exporter
VPVAPLAALTGWSIRRPVVVVITWIALVAGCFAAGSGLFERLVSDVGVVSGSESGRGQEQIRRAGPEPVELTCVVTPRTPGDPAAPEQIRAAIADLRRMPTVAQVTDPIRSAGGGDVRLLRVELYPGAGSGPAATVVAQRLRQIPASTVVVAGGPLTEHEFNTQAQTDVQRAELISAPVVLLLLLLVFGGVVAAGLPLLVAVVGAGGSLGVLYAFSLVSDVSVYAVQVATMLSVGLAVDYGLLTVSRFRQERAAGPDVAAALARTGVTAGHTVVFSGLTVAAALAGLVVFPDPFLRSMGMAGVAVVGVVVAASVTLLPALLALVGHRISPAPPAAPGAGVFARIARAVQRRPLLTALAAAGVMVTLALPAAELRLGQGDARSLPAGTQTRQLHDAIAAHYPELDRPAPIMIAATTPPGSPQLAQFSADLAAIPQVAAVRTRTVAALTEWRVDLIPGTDGDAAARAVTSARAVRAPIAVAVTGAAASLVDYRAMLAERLPWALGLVAFGTLILLFAFTGSVLLPVKAVLTNLLSIGAALGAVVWVFQQGHLAGWLGTERLDSTHLSVPVLVGAIAFGLSVDYEVFLLSRIRESHLAGAGDRQAVADGLQQTGRIITSAALLLGVVFAGFLAAGFVPVKAIGLGLVLAVGLDATVVRLLLVPATMTLFGRYNWWAPGPLRLVHARGEARGTDGGAAGPAADAGRAAAATIRIDTPAGRRQRDVTAGERTSG